MPIAGALDRVGELVVARTVQILDDEAFAPWREAATARGIESVAAIPLRHGQTVYGILCVYATDVDAFTDREVEAFQFLGETVGFVINAIKRRRLLFAAAVTDLELTVGPDASIVARLATDLECAVSLAGYVDLDECWVCYLEVDGAAPDSVLDALAGDPAVETARVVGPNGEAHRFEVEVRDEAVLDAADAIGATVRTATADAGTALITFEVAEDADVRESVDLLLARLPDASLRSKRQRDRRPIGPGSPDGLLAELTDSQREALSVAVRAGYYEWPRESSAEEVARTLGIARPTLHAHLRKAERAIFEALVE